jgi:hypothetical protein
MSWVRVLLVLTLCDAGMVVLGEVHHFSNLNIKGERCKEPSHDRRLQELLQTGNGEYDCSYCASRRGGSYEPG